MSVFDDLLTQIPLSLNAPRAPSLIVQIRFELDGQCARRLHHRVEARHRVADARQDDEEAQPCDRGALKIPEIERARLREARDAECGLACDPVAMKNPVAAVREP